MTQGTELERGAPRLGRGGGEAEEPRWGVGSSLEEDEVLDDDVNHENGDDVPGTWERGSRLGSEFPAHPHNTPASKHQTPHFADGVTESSGSAYPAKTPPSTPPGVSPTLGTAVQVDEGPVVQGEHGEEREDGRENAPEALGVGVTEQSPEDHREEDRLFRAKAGSQGPNRSGCHKPAHRSTSGSHPSPHGPGYRDR